MTASAAISGYACTLQLGDSATPKAYTSIAEVSRITGIGVSRDTIEVTHLTSDDEWKEFAYGMAMSGNFGAEVNYLPANATQQGLLTNTQAASPYNTWRLLLSDFGAVTKTSVVSGSTWTSAAHGFLTGQSIRLTTSGTIPTGFTVGKTYWLKRAGASTFTLHLTPAAAAAGSGAITASDAGTGTHTANGTTIWTFNAACSGFTCEADPNGKFSGQVQFSSSGAASTAP